MIDRNRTGTLLTYRESQTLDTAGRRRIMQMEDDTIAPLRAAYEDGVAEGVFRAVPADLVTHTLKVAAHGWALKHWNLRSQVGLEEYVEGELDLLLHGLST